MKSILPYFLLGAAATAAEPEHWKGVGGIAATDEISHIHVTNLLRAHHIESRISGSVVHGIEVPTPKAEDATRLLREDAAKGGYYIWFGGGDYIKAGECKEHLSQLAVAAALNLPEYARATPLGRFLRDKAITPLTKKYPYIFSLKMHERRYLATPTDFLTGYDIELDLQDTLAAKRSGYSGTYQVLDDGRHIVFVGSSDWTFGGK